MGPAEAIRTGFARSVQFSGRASQLEFWWFALAVVLVTGLASVADGILWPDMAARLWLHFGDDAAQVTVGAAVSPLVTLAAITVAVPVLAAMVHRLHDAGFSGKPALAPLLALCLVSAVVALSVFVLPATGASRPIMICLLLLGASLFLATAWLCRRADPHTTPYGPPPSEVTP